MKRACAVAGRRQRHLAHCRARWFQVYCGIRWSMDELEACCEFSEEAEDDDELVELDVEADDPVDASEGITPGSPEGVVKEGYKFAARLV